MSNQIVGMYVHQHWSYNHPYCARTWTFGDWRGYIEALKRIGYNTVLIWPVLETMPEPLTDSDRASLEKLAKVIDLAHDEFGMRAYFVLCPNVAADNDLARQYAFEKRPYYNTARLVDLGDPVVMGKLITWRESLCRWLAKADGMFIIDSDPGGWPNSTNLEFVHLLCAHRRMLDRLRPGIELDYWMAHGWEGYCRFYATGELQQSTDEELHDCLRLLAKQNPEPWAIASGRGAEIAEPLGLQDRMLAFNYGAIEGEPSFPLTRFDDGYAYEGGAKAAARGALGNAQTHVVQLPNTFAFARAAQGLSCTEADYVSFADDLIPGQGRLVVDGWKVLQGTDAEQMLAVAQRLTALLSEPLKLGPLGGLLFGEPARFVADLAKQLRTIAALEVFQAEVAAEPRDMARVADSFARFVHAIAVWQAAHGYQNHWYWEKLVNTLRALDRATLNETLDTLRWVGEGSTPFEAVRNGLAHLETYTPRLIEAMKLTLADIRGELTEDK